MRPQDKCVIMLSKMNFLSSPQKYVVDTQKIRFNEMVIFEHQKHVFKLMGMEIITILR